MATAIQRPHQMVVTLEDNVSAGSIRRVLKSIRGVASVRMARIGDDNGISPTLRRKINKARREYAQGETVVCDSPEAMQQYFDSL